MSASADTIHASMNNCWSDYGIRSARGPEEMLDIF